MSKLIIFASGYPRPYTSDQAEISSAQASTWYPSSTDFKITAGKSGTAAGAGTLDDVIKIIQKQPAGSIELLGLMGHAAGGGTSGFKRTLGMTGQITVKPADVILMGRGFINEKTLTAKASQIKALHDRFSDKARIVLYACHTGADSDLLDAISNAFGVCVDGFASEVLWCVNWSGRSVNMRGRVWVDGPGTPSSALQRCQDFHEDATDLKPDLSSCVGVP